MSIVTYSSPFRSLSRVEQDLDRLWEETWGLKPTSLEMAPMDLYEENGKLIAEVNLPNFKKEEIKVNVDGGVLEVTAKHQEKEEQKDKRHYLFRESSNEYWRRVVLPETASGDRAAANFKDGVLRVAMPIAVKKNNTKNIAVK